MFDFLKEKIAAKRSRFISSSLQKSTKSLEKDNSESTNNLVISASSAKLKLEKMARHYPDNRDIQDSLETVSLIEGLACLKVWAKEEK